MVLRLIPKLKRLVDFDLLNGMLYLLLVSIVIGLFPILRIILCRAYVYNSIIKKYQKSFEIFSGNF